MRAPRTRVLAVVAPRSHGRPAIAPTNYMPVTGMLGLPY